MMHDQHRTGDGQESQKHLIQTTASEATCTPNTLSSEGNVRHACTAQGFEPTLDKWSFLGAPKFVAPWRRALFISTHFWVLAVH